MSFMLPIGSSLRGMYIGGGDQLKYIDEKGQGTLVNQAANYELAQSENRDTVYNLLNKYDRYTDIEKLNPRALDSVIRTEFDRDWSNNLRLIYVLDRITTLQLVFFLQKGYLGHVDPCNI